MFNLAAQKFFSPENAVGMIGNVAVFDDGNGGYILLDLNGECSVGYVEGGC